MLFEARLISAGGLHDSYYCFEADSVAEAQEEAKKYATNTVSRMFGSHYSGKIKLWQTLGPVSIPFSWTREKEVSQD